MNRLFVFLLMVICLSVTSLANDRTNPKYLAGAVQMVDGKIVFSQEFDMPSASKNEVFERMLVWAKKQFVPKDEFNSRVVYQNIDKGQIAAVGEQYLVFTSTALSLDRSKVLYQCIISCTEGKAVVEITRIRYEYGWGRDMETYVAEEWINDKMALNKSKTKLAPVCGKFRRETIDMKDELFASAASALGVQVVKEQVAETPAKPVTEHAVQQTESSKTVSFDELPALLTSLMKDGRMTITAGNNEEFEISAENWGGLGKLFTKNVAYILMDDASFAANALLQHSDTYTISVYAQGKKEAAVMMECKKNAVQKMSAEDVAALKQSASASSDKTYTMYTGEITSLKVN